MEDLWFYCTVLENFIVSLPQFHGCWQNTWDSWVSGKELFFHSVGISMSECFSLSPRPMEAACIGPDECYTHSEVVLQEKNLKVKIELRIVNSYWKWKSLSRVNSLRPHDCIVHGLLQARILEWVAFPFSRVLPNPGIEPRSTCIANRFFTSWATREAQEYWSG